MEGAYWITGSVLVGLAGVLTYLYFAVRPVLPYLYVNTMLQSRSGKFLTKSKITTLVESKNLTEFVNGLTDTFYQVDGSDLEDIHEAFTHRYVSLLTDIKNNTPKEFTELINTYALLAEGSVIRYLYRSKFLGKPINSSYVYAIGVLTQKQLSSMQSANDFAEFKALFSPTIYRKIMLREHNSVEDFEHSMDEFISDEIQTRLKKLKIADKNLIRDLFKMILDQHNIMASFQSIVRGAPVHLLDGGFVSKQKLKSADSVDAIQAAVENTLYAPAFAQAKIAYAETARSAYFEIALERLIIDIAQKEVLSKPQGAFSIFVHMLRAKQDKQNVQVISKGIEAQLTKTKIEEMIV